MAVTELLGQLIEGSRAGLVGGDETPVHSAAPSNSQLLQAKSGVVGLLTNSPFLIAVLAFAIAQLTKFGLMYLETRELHWERLVGSGGMPSSHSAFVSGLACAVGIRDGTSSSVFAVALVLALVVMYDAVGLRLHSGRHAAALNLIISELPAEHPINPMTFGQLREQLGHTPAQVAAGGLLGMVLALLVQGALGPAQS